MNANAGHPALRRELAEAFDAWLASVPPADVARILGVAHSTISRDRARKPGLEAYSLVDFLALVAHTVNDGDRRLWGALEAYCCGQTYEPQPLAAVTTCYDVIDDLTVAMRKMNAAVRDHLFTEQEAFEMEQAAHAVLRDLPRFLANVRAAVFGVCR